MLHLVAVAASAFPSASYGLIIPGGHEAAGFGSSVGSALPSAESVKEWEIQHADTSFGGDFGPAGRWLSTNPIDAPEPVRSSSVLPESSTADRCMYMYPIHETAMCMTVGRRGIPMRT